MRVVRSHAKKRKLACKIEVTRLTKRYGHARSGPRHRFLGRDGRSLRAARAQRCGQDIHSRSARGLQPAQRRRGAGARSGSSAARGGSGVNALGIGASGRGDRAVPQGPRGVATQCRILPPPSFGRRCARARRPRRQGGRTREDIVPVASSAGSTSGSASSAHPSCCSSTSPRRVRPSARRGAWELVEKLKGKGTTIILTTHYMDEAQHLADRVVVINRRRDRRGRHARDDRRPRPRRRRASGSRSHPGSRHRDSRCLSNVMALDVHASSFETKCARCTH